MWEYLAEHPWWGLCYLVIICFTVALSCSELSEWGLSYEQRRKKKDPEKDKK